MSQFRFVGLFIGLVAFTGYRGVAREEDQTRNRPPIQAPPGHAVVSEDLRGWYFVPREIKERYEAAVSKLEGIRRAVLEGTLSPDQAKAQLESLKDQLETLKKEMDDKKVLVSGGKLHEQTEVLDIPLGPNRCVAITVNQVILKGWEGKGIRCELKKTVLSQGNEPVEPHLKAIKISHKFGRADFAGKTDKEREASEKAFLEGPGAKLTEAQKAGRSALVKQIQDSARPYQAFVAKEVDQISVEGLGYQENAWISRDVESKGGEKRSGGRRQRYASLTVYLPPCETVCVRGARMGFQADNLRGDLVITKDGSTDSDHMARNAVKNLQGNLDCWNFPLHFIENVTGNLWVGIGQDFGLGGSGLTHFGSMRELYPPAPLALQVRTVQGSTRIRVGRCDLDLADLRGQVEIENEFGNVKWAEQGPLAKGRNQVMLGSGQLEIAFSPATWKSQPIVAATRFGRIKTDLGRDEWVDFSQTVPTSSGTNHHNWMGFQPAPKPMASGIPRVMIAQIIESIIQGKDQGEEGFEGLMLINQAGPSQIHRVEKVSPKP